MSNNIINTEYVTMYNNDGIVYMILHNGVQNKIQHPEFINRLVFQEYMEAENPIALVIKGEKRHFSAGADIERISKENKSAEDFEDELNKGKNLLHFIENLSCITIAQISGACCGGGLEIALSCQFRIAADNALFAFPECKLGLLPGMGGTVRLQKIIGRSNAIRMIVSGESFFAEEAYRLGLVNMLCEKEMLDKTVTEFISTLCDKKSSEHISDIISAINRPSYEYESELFVKRAGLNNLI